MCSFSKTLRVLGMCSSFGAEFPSDRRHSRLFPTGPGQKPLLARFHPGRVSSRNLSACLWGLWFPGLLVLGIVAVAPAASAATEVPARDGDTVGWHTVQEGETLSGITAHYLGFSGLWPENWRLNPDVKNPDFLVPGRRIRVILKREASARTAEIADLQHKVKKKLQPEDWTAARKGDVLVEKDGVHTFKNSSARLDFDDGVSLLVTEESLLFLRKIEAALTGVPKEEIEIVQGQADLKIKKAGRRPSSIEIVVGSAQIRSQAISGQRLETRMRRPSQGGAQLMVYAGRGEMESGGIKVNVKQGQGTSAPEGGPPAPPERLLPAPRLLRPVKGAEQEAGKTLFSWRSVPKAASYTLEVCRDPECARLVKRTTGLS